MAEVDFYEILQAHFDDVLPFVAYRKPNKKKVTAFLQRDSAVYLTDNFSESGFVFAPFDNDSAAAATVLIPRDLSEQIHSEFTGNTFQDSKNADDPKLDLSPTAKARERHIHLVKKGITEIKKGILQKVVLSRKQTIPAITESPMSILKRLLYTYPTAFVYCWYHPKVGLWLGATPETLLSIKNRQLHTMSLAGTQKDKNLEDVRWGEKELEEQRLVTQSIKENLKPLVNDLEVSPVKTHKAGTLLHLKTDISATIDTSKASLKDILIALHPTPAVCGLPKSRAKKFILEKEYDRRNYYTGFLGELNLTTEKQRSSNRRNIENLAYRSFSKSTALFVNLRCMEIDAQGAQLFVGGGITASSDPEAEWEETVNKLQTIGSIL